MPKSSWLTALLAIATLSSLPAQRLRIAGPPPGSPLLVSRVSRDSEPRAVIHGWQEPAIIGGALLGTVTQLFSFGFCTDAETGHANCVLTGETGFLFGGAVGGLTAGLIGSSSTPRLPPKGKEFHGDRRVFGAVMLGVPSLAVNVLGMNYYCRQSDHFIFTRSGCTFGNFLAVVVGTGLNALIGYWLGKGVPAVREVTK
jgi:hypothetical protein